MLGDFAQAAVLTAELKTMQHEKGKAILAVWLIAFATTSNVQNNLLLLLLMSK
jgi:hypothetical protein